MCKKVIRESGINDVENLKEVKLEFQKNINKNVYSLIVAFLNNNKDNIGDIITKIEGVFIEINTNEKLNEDGLKKFNIFLNTYSVIEKLTKISKNYEKEYYNTFILSKKINEFEYFKSGNEWLKLLYFTIQFLSIESILPKDHPNSLESYILYMKEIYEKFKEDSHNNFDDKQEAIFKILENKINYILLKLDLLIAEKIDNLNLKTLIEKLDLTIYKEVKDILIFYKRDEHSKIDEISKLYLADIGKSTKKSLDYYFLVKYFKDETSDIEKLEELYNEYKGSYGEEFKNIIFIGNNLLSLYVEINEGDIDKKIEKLYNELNRKQRGNYKNYFTYLKYAEYKIKILSKILLSDTNIREIEKLYSEIENIKNIIISIYESGSFFELSNNESFLDNDIDIIKGDIPKIYSPNLIKIDEKYTKDIRVERLESKIEYLDFIIKQNRTLKEQVSGYKKEITKQFDDTRNKQIEILAIFSAIVLFVSGTIQLYTRLDDLESAIIFTLFFAGVISIIISLVFKTKSYIKWVNLTIAIGLMLLGLFFPFVGEKIGFENKILNINLIDDKIRLLDSKLNELEYKKIKMTTKNTK